jgi:phage host-nuclease inhibitor protein Gam
MIASAKASELHLFAILNLFRITVAPFKRHFGISIGIHKDVESAVSVQHWQESHGRRNLPENGLDFRLNFRLGLLLWRIASPGIVKICKVNWVF